MNIFNWVFYTLLGIFAGILIMGELFTATHPIPIRVLESNTASYIKVNDQEERLYKKDDTVWVNLLTHKIDDIDSFAMKAVILTK